MEKFLTDGKIIKKKESSKGVTDAFRVTLSDGTVTHDAQVQNVDISKAFFEVDPKHTEATSRTPTATTSPPTVWPWLSGSTMSRCRSSVSSRASLRR
jgi:hypothetical protein